MNAVKGSSEVRSVQSPTSDSFCIATVAKELQFCRLDGGDVDLKHFAGVYEELSKFIGMLGRIFEFVQKDVNEKIRNINSFYEKNPKDYCSIAKMIVTEKGGKNMGKSCCASVLLLNRALEFVMDFLDSATEAADSDSMPQICRTSYDKTLAKHHPWIVRKAVGIAVHTLPSKERLTTCIKGRLAEENELKEFVRRVVADGSDVYSRIDAMYTKNELHKIV
ncbi:unnamed protein product [Caenorhabditis auriculariae]|uniref:Glycolipid transfer protein domain-containing protein n=1 Tax=Caenorhabditis auriculariae TaxID=2777116 RepID=A0A8S1GMV1_9PELO|nr:unnamed protein product [Caenorhabditis auriculariae]